MDLNDSEKLTIAIIVLAVAIFLLAASIFFGLGGLTGTLMQMTNKIIAIIPQ